MQQLIVDVQVILSPLGIVYIDSCRLGTDTCLGLLGGLSGVLRKDIRNLLVAAVVFLGVKESLVSFCAELGLHLLLLEHLRRSFGLLGAHVHHRPVLSLEGI